MDRNDLHQMNEMKSDVLIVGGGVAGSATALALQQRGLTTIIVERSDNVLPRVGEHLPPDVKPVLGQLGLWERFLADEHLRCPGIRSSWGSADYHEREYIFSPFGCGWNLDRQRFDAMLASVATESGARILYGARLAAINAQAAGWTVETNHADGGYLISSDFLVDATGRSSAVSRRLGATRLRYDTLIGVIGWMSADEHIQNTDASLWLEATEKGWWYATRLPNRRLVVALMTDPYTISKRNTNVQHLWHKRLQQTHYIRQHVEDFESIQPVSVKPANTYCMEPAVGAGWLAVGDAASAFDPLSSRGIAHALRSGMLAAVTIEGFLSGISEALDEYAIHVQNEFNDYLVTRTAYYRQEKRWSDQPFWQSRHYTI